MDAAEKVARQRLSVLQPAEAPGNAHHPSLSASEQSAQT